MAVTDPIADYLTRIRNAQLASHRIVEIPTSKMKRGITEILYDQGFIHKYIFDGMEGKGAVIKIALKYLEDSNKPLIRSLQRLSKPGLRKYSSSGDIPRVINGLGIVIVSTSHGLMTDKEAKKRNLGGELVCSIY